MLTKNSFDFGGVHIDAAIQNEVDTTIHKVHEAIRIEIPEIAYCEAAVRQLRSFGLGLIAVILRGAVCSFEVQGSNLHRRYVPSVIADDGNAQVGRRTTNSAGSCHPLGAGADHRPSTLRTSVELCDDRAQHVDEALLGPPRARCSGVGNPLQA